MTDSDCPTRQPRPGETCVCGKPAVIVYLRRLGAVPTCQKPKGKLTNHGT